MEKLLDKFRAHNQDQTCQSGQIKNLKMKIDKVSKIILNLTIGFIKSQLNLSERKKWITSEAHDIIINKLECLNNYLD